MLRSDPSEIICSSESAKPIRSDRACDTALIRAVRPDVLVKGADYRKDEVVGTELDNVVQRGKDIPSALGDAARLLERRAFR